jgi:hypothetical protein
MMRFLYEVLRRMFLVGVIVVWITLWTLGVIVRAVLRTAAR